jgi:hypothetical protein
MISGLLATCELLQYGLLETHGVSLRIGPAGQLIVLSIRDQSIAAAHGGPPPLLKILHFALDAFMFHQCH